MSDQAAHVLSYESRADAARPWGPWLWRPSVVAMVLLLLVAGMGAWVKWRHEAWVAIGQQDSLGYKYGDPPTLFFAADDRLVVADMQGARLHDVQGQLLARLSPGTLFWARCCVRSIPGYGESLVLSSSNGDLVLADPLTGDIRTSATLPTTQILPDVNVCMLSVADISPDGKQAIVHEGEKGACGLIEMTRLLREPTTRGLRPLGSVAGARFTRDGRWLIAYCRRPGAFPVTLVMDATSLETLHELPGEPWYPEGAEHADERFLVAMESLRSAPKVYSLATGQRIADLPLGPSLVACIAISDDGRRAAAIVLGNRDLKSRRLIVWELPSGREVYHRVLATFRGGTRSEFMEQLGQGILAPAPDADGAWLWSRSLPYPIAVFAHEDTQPRQVAVSPGRCSVAVAYEDGTIITYRRVGYECRESILGVLGMPHALGLIGAGLLLALVTWRDARRGRGPAGAMMSAASLAMVLVGAGLSLALFLEWCIGRREPNVGPALLLCGLGLATAGRGWRWIALVALAGCLALGAWGLQAMFSGGLRHDISLRILDRVWEVPSLWPFAAVSAGLAAAAGAIVVVARRAS